MHTLNQAILNCKTGSELWFNVSTQIAIWLFEGDVKNMTPWSQLEDLLLQARAKGFYYKKDLTHLPIKQGREIRISASELAEARALMNPVGSAFSNYAHHDFVWEYTYVEGVVVGHDKEGYPIVEGSKISECYQDPEFYRDHPTHSASNDGYSLRGALWYKEVATPFKGAVK